MQMQEAPTMGGEVAKRELHLFWLVDCSYSMGGRKIATLNQAIREVIPEIKDALSSHPQVRMMMRAIKFSSDAHWHIGPDPVELDDFVWEDLKVDGCTATAQAIDLLSSEFTIEKMPKRGFPPVCILLSDGECTDPEEEYEHAIKNFKSLPWGKKAVKLTIGIGDDYDEDSLMKFVSNKEIGVIQANTPQELIRWIKWTSVTASVGASITKSSNLDTKRIGEGSNVDLGRKPDIKNEVINDTSISSDDVF